MELILDISEEYKKLLDNGDSNGNRRINMDSEVKRKIELQGVRNALLNTIPNGITNGELIELLFANVWNETEEFFQETVSWYPILSNGLGDEVHFDKDWWYAPYKENE